MELAEEPVATKWRNVQIVVDSECPANCEDLGSDAESFMCALDLCSSDLIGSGGFSSPSGDDVSQSGAITNTSVI